MYSALFFFWLPTLVSPLFWLRTAGKVGWESPCPLGKVLTYKNLIYLLNFPFYCVNTSYLVDRCRITTHWLAGSLNKGEFLRTLGTLRVNPVKAKLAPFKGITPCTPPPPPLLFPAQVLVLALAKSTIEPRGRESSELTRKKNRNHDTIFPIVLDPLWIMEDQD